MHCAAACESLAGSTSLSRSVLHTAHSEGLLDERLCTSPLYLSFPPAVLRFHGGTETLLSDKQKCREELRNTTFRGSE